jgi:hypothetical protein
VFQNIIYLFGAFFIIGLIKKRHTNVNILLICKYVTLAVLINNVLALMNFLSSDFFKFTMSIQSISEEKAAQLERSTLIFASRFVGIGLGSYFPGGVFSIIGMVCCSFIIQNEQKKLGWWFLFFVITGLGICIARTTFVGLFFSSLIITRYLLKRRHLSNLPKRVMITILFVLLLILVFNYMYYTMMDNALFRHAFELFINLIQTGKFATKSSDTTMRMFVMPNNIRTFLIGDGLFYYPDGRYYMYTDVGYLRLFYYYGFAGLILFFSPQIFISIIISRTEKDVDIKFLLIVLVSLVFVVNLKGLVDFNWLMFLFFAKTVKNKSYNYYNNTMSSYT